MNCERQIKLGDILKENIIKALNYIKARWVIIAAVAALLVPDITVRCALKTKLFDEPFNSIIPILFSLCWVSLVIYICRVILPRKAGRIVYVVFGAAFMTLAFSNYVYYQIFGQFFWLSSVGLVGEAGGYVKYAMGYVTLQLAAATVIDVALLALVYVNWDDPVRRSIKRSGKVVIPIIGIALLHLFMQPKVFGILEDDWDSWSKPRVVYKQFTDVNKSLNSSGLYQFVARDFWKSRFPTVKYDETEYAQADEFFAEKNKKQENDYSGIFEGKNVIAVMMESMDDWLIDEKYTPTISYMMKNGINFADYYAPTFGSGYTFNSEYTFNTGFYTPRSAVTATNFSGNSYPYSMPNLFKNKGYRVNSYHYNNPEFYNRGIMHRSLGYEKYNSFTKLGMTVQDAENDSNATKGDEVYRAMTANEPFFDFLITYSGHIPYTYDDTKLSVAKRNHPELIDPSMDTETNNIRLLARDTDDFFRFLLERLNNDGLLENTVIVAFADHYAYGFSNETLLKKYSHDAGSDILYKVPAFIYSYGTKPVRVEKTMKTADLMPTLINLFGLEDSRKYIGEDVFDDRYDGFVYFEDMSWYDGKEMHTPPDDGEKASETEYEKEQDARVEKMVDINDIVITGNYFGRDK